MALCKQFEQLNFIEKRQWIGELNHVVTNDEHLYYLACRLINYAKEKGMLDNIIFNPKPTEEDNLSHV